MHLLCARPRTDRLADRPGARGVERRFKAPRQTVGSRSLSAFGRIDG